MPLCKNDPTKKYKGIEPSPKGFGYCAHTEKVGEKRKGRDGNQWIVKKVSNGSKRWVKHSSENNISTKTYNILYKWFLKLSESSLLIIYKNGKYIMYKSKKKTRTAIANDMKVYHKSLSDNKDVKYIIWSAMSYDTFEHFINYINHKLPKKDKKLLMTSKKPIDTMVKYPLKYFTKYELFTTKDYTLKQNI